MDKHWAQADELSAKIDQFEAEKDAGLNRELHDCCGEESHFLNKLHGREAATISACGIGIGKKNVCCVCGEHKDTMYFKNKRWHCAAHKNEGGARC